MEVGTLKRRDAYVWRDLGGEVIILNDEGTQVCMLNETASPVWVLSDGETSLSEIAAQICQRFDVDAAEAMADVYDFAQQLIAADLAEWVSSSNPADSQMDCP